VWFSGFALVVVVVLPGSSHNRSIAGPPLGGSRASRYDGVIGSLSGVSSPLLGAVAETD
jgi:hypothetical protein